MAAAGRRFIRFVFIVSCLWSANVFAVPTDCIGASADGVAQCTQPFPTAWSYGTCVNNSLSTTVSAGDYCAGQFPLVDEASIIDHIDCLPKRQLGACATNVGWPGWSAPGSTNNTYWFQCGNLSADTRNGVEVSNFAVTGPTYTFGSYCQSLPSGSASTFCASMGGKG